MKSFTWLIFFFIRLSSGLEYYQVNVTFYLNNVHLVALEYQDLVNKRGRVEIQTGQEITKYYYYTDPWQVVTISDKGECRVDKDSYNEFDTKFTYFGWSDQDFHVRGPSAILFRNRTDNPFWKSRGIVRGILCDQYDAFHMNHPEIKISYYFTAPSWHNPLSLTSGAPVRVRTLIGNVSSVWDFMHFRVGVHDVREFQIPTGIGCENFDSQDKPRLPDFTPRYSFVAQMMDPSGISLINWKVWYDSKRKIMQIKEAQYDTFREVQDFNTGIAYHVDGLGECTISSIKESITEKRLRDLIAVIKDAKEMLNLDGSVYYIGKDKVRGMDVDVWETVKENQVFWNKQFKKVVITFYFTQTQVQIFSEEQENTQVPVMIRISPHYDDPIFQVDESFELHFFDFHQKMDDDFYSEVSVEDCFLEETKREVFVLSFIVDTMHYETAMRQTKMFKNSVAHAIKNELSISPLRLKIIKVDFEPGIIYVRGVIFEKTPISIGFHIPEDNRYVPNVGTELMQSVAEEGYCAVQCITRSSITCTGFTVCPGVEFPFDCYLTTVTNIDNWPKQIETPGCKFYERSVYSDLTEDIPLEIATDDLYNSVFDMNFRIMLKNETGDMVSYYAYDIEAAKTLERPALLDKFAKVSDNHQLENSVSLKVMEKVASTAECSKMCLDDKRVQCASFSFCHNTHECLISSLYVRRRRDEGKIFATSCEVYHKSAVHFFNKIKGKSSGTEGVVSMKDKSPGECALACKEEKSFDCRGFDYCRDERTCTLITVHQLDLPALNESPSCIYYTRKLRFDFEPKGHHMVTAEGRSFSFISKTLEECAKLCLDYYQEKHVTCKSLNFCIENNYYFKCWINMDTVDDPGVEIIDGTSCLYFESKPPSQVDLEGPDDHVSNQTFDVILSCLFILGITLGSAGSFGYSQFGKKKNEADNMTVHYSRDAREGQTQTDE